MRERVVFWWRLVREGWHFVGTVADPWGRVVFIAAILATLVGANLPEGALRIGAVHGALWGAFAILVGGYILEGAWQAHVATSRSPTDGSVPLAAFAAGAQALTTLPAGNQAVIVATHQLPTGEKTSLQISTAPAVSGDASLQNPSALEIRSAEEPAEGQG